MRSEGVPITSYIMKTTGRTVEYVKAVPGRQEDATINLDIDLENLDLSKFNNGTMGLLKNAIRATVSLHGIDEMWSRMKLFAAIGLGSTQLVMYQKIKALKKIGSYTVNGGLR
jgi:hypothetical protein